jgi:hypothetical protein
MLASFHKPAASVLTHGKERPTYQNRWWPRMALALIDVGQHAMATARNIVTDAPEADPELALGIRLEESLERRKFSGSVADRAGVEIASRHLCEEVVESDW